MWTPTRSAGTPVHDGPEGGIGLQDNAVRIDQADPDGCAVEGAAEAGLRLDQGPSDTSLAPKTQPISWMVKTRPAVASTASACTNGWGTKAGDQTDRLCRADPRR